MAVTMTECRTCRNFQPLQHGAVGICLFAWRKLEWFDEVPLKMRESTCDDYVLRRPRGEPTPASEK